MFKICESCNSEFETSITSQTECGSCLVRPGNARSRTYAKKICIDCSKKFSPSGPRTLRCPNCTDRKNDTLSDTWDNVAKDYTPGCLTADTLKSPTKPPKEDKMTESTAKIKQPSAVVKDSSIGSLCQGILSLTGADEISMVIDDLEISITKIKTEGVDQ